MDNSKFLKTVIIILLLINIGTLAFMWLGNGHHGPPLHERDNALDFMTRKLNLTDEQIKKLEVLRKDHHDIMEQLNHEDRNMHDRYFELLSRPTDDSLKVNEMANEMAASRKKIELQTFYHFKQVRAICNAEQQKKFDELIGDALSEMGKHRPGR